MTPTEREEILAAIDYYSKLGRDWGDVVCFLSLKYTGRLELFLNPYCMRKRGAK